MRKNKAGAKIVHVNPEISGRPDAVEATTNCVVNKFNVDGCGWPTELKDFPDLYGCKLMASCSGGRVSLLLQDVGEMFTIRLEDLEALLAAAHSLQ